MQWPVMHLDNPANILECIMAVFVYCIYHSEVSSCIYRNSVSSLQKQVGCFNHRVVALVADKLERQWSVEVCFDVED